VVESVGVTLCEPLGCTAPMPSMLTSVALVVCHVSVVEAPLSIVSGLALNDAVGAAGGGGGGGGGGAAFFLQAPNIMTAPTMKTIANPFSLFTFSSVEVSAPFLRANRARMGQVNFSASPRPE
jgi:hypothetical protein